MIRRPPTSTRTDTLVPYPSLLRSVIRPGARLDRGGLSPCRSADGGIGPSAGRRRRGWLVARLRVQRGGDRDASARHRARRLQTDGARSEEHTSELQSLMRISYAVFCLKKKKNKQ